MTSSWEYDGPRLIADQLSSCLSYYGLLALLVAGGIVMSSSLDFSSRSLTSYTDILSSQRMKKQSLAYYVRQSNI